MKYSRISWEKFRVVSISAVPGELFVSAELGELFCSALACGFLVVLYLASC
jgi:hypothetical protein